MWRPNIAIKDFSSEPFAIGTSWSDVSKFVGRDMVVKVEVAALETDRLFAMKQEVPSFSGNATWDFSPVTDDSGKATLSFDGEVSGWLGGLASGLLRSQAQKSMERDLGNLKATLESS